MRNLILSCAIINALSMASINAIADETAQIKEEAAIQSALKEIGVEVLGIRYDKPDTQWDVFIRSGEKAYEIEIDAVSGKVVSAEQESIEEIQAELAGNLSHEGVSGDVD